MDQFADLLTQEQHDRMQAVRLFLTQPKHEDPTNVDEVLPQEAAEQTQ